MRTDTLRISRWTGFFIEMKLGLRIVAVILTVLVPAIIGTNVAKADVAIIRFRVETKAKDADMEAVGRLLRECRKSRKEIQRLADEINSLTKEIAALQEKIERKAPAK